MKRKIYQERLNWKEEGGKAALLIDGARRVGKSYIAEEFARREYKSYILIDFNRVAPEVRELFDHYLENLPLLFLYLSNYYNVRLYERESLIILDEVQLCPRARAAIKFLVADGRYDYLETGSRLGLKLNMDRLSLKCYMADTGLLISHAFDENGLLREELYRKLLFDKLEINQGMILENIVAQMLLAAGHKLYFYANTSREDASSRMEIDFLIAKEKISSRYNISPIEVKSGKNYTLSSLRKFKAKFAESLNQPIVLHTGDLREEEDILFLPHDMTPLL